jgi:hypothetical protein
MPNLIKDSLLVWFLCCSAFSLQAKNKIDSLDARDIITKAIAVAPAHAKALRHYKADVLIQHTGKWNRIPNIWKALLRAEGVEEGLLYQSESFAHFSVDTAHTYLFDYLAVRNNYHAQPQADPFVNPDFYKPVLGTGGISPLSPKALAYYDIQLLGTKVLKGESCYVLSVKPRFNNDEKVFSGTIALSINGLWLVELSLAFQHFNIDYEFLIDYEKQGERWCPSNFKVRTLGGVMGFVGQYEYVAKVSNYDFNATIPLAVVRPKEHEFREIYNLQERNFEVQQLKQVMSSMASNLKRQWSDANIASGLNRYDKVTLSPGATEQGDDYWNALKKEEAFQIYTGNLTLAIKNKSSLPVQPDLYANFRQANLKLGIGSVLFSRSFFWGDNSRGFYPHEIYYKSPVLDFNFNTVEGFVQNTGALYRYRLNRYDWYEIDPTWRYSYNLGQSSGTLKLRWKTEQDDISLTGGRFISQYNVDTPIGLDLNSLSTLLLKKNYVKLYQKDFVNFTYQQRFSNKWSIRTSLEYARRSPLENTTDYYWINFQNEPYTPNFPKNQEMADTHFAANDAFQSSFQVNYRPFLKKQYRNGLRLVDLSSSPLIIFKYRGAFKEMLKTDMHFQTIELGITHNFPLSINTNFNYIAQTGVFLNRDAMTFADYKHFNGNNNMISIGDMLTTHRLVGFYDNNVWGASKKFIDPFKYSTNGTYIDIMTMAGFRKLAITQMPWVRKLGIREEFFANYLYLGNQNLHYAEFGYGIDGVARIFRVEFGYRLENWKFTKDNPTASLLMPIVRIALNARLRGGVTPEW